ncbi:hypothetical protein BHM03_00036182, partial [Ensete ventricosum]
LRPWPPPPSPPSDHRSPPLSPPYGCLQTLASIAPPPRPPSLLADSLLPPVSAAVSSDHSVVAPTQAPKPSFLLCGVVSLWISHDFFSKRDEVADGGGWCMKVADEAVVANNTFEGDGRAIGFRFWFLSLRCVSVTCILSLFSFLMVNGSLLISHVYVLQVAKTVDLIKAKGGKVTREPGPVKGGKSVIAFIEDPDGYKFELLERGPTPEPFCQVMLRVGDLDRSINFYEKVIWQ